MLSRLEAAERDLDDVMLRLADPEVVADQRTYRDLARRHAELTSLVDLFRSWRQADPRPNELPASIVEPGMLIFGLIRALPPDEPRTSLARLVVALRLHETLFVFGRQLRSIDPQRAGEG